jgi:trigger factor
LADGFVPGEELEVTVRCDVWPEIQWKAVEGKEKPYLGLTGKYKRKPFNQERFDQALRDLKERYVKLEAYEDGSHSLAMGDACTVNMVGYMATADGEKGEPLPDAASGDNVEVVLGSGLYMEGLVEGLEGGTVGETKTVKVRFPAALKNKDLAGKDAIFDVTILSASKRILPEITDEFANQVRPGLTADSLRDELRKAVDSQDAQEYMGARNEALGGALSEIMDVDVPDTLVTNQAREKYALMMTDMRNSGMADEEIKKLISPENFVKYKDIEKPDIVRDFKISMAVDEIARLENIQVPAYQVEEQMQSLKDQAAKEGTATDDMEDDKMRRKVENTLERRMVYDFLADAADLEVEYVDEEEFDEALMEKLAAESLAREQTEEGEGEQLQEEVVVTPPTAQVAAVEEKVEAAGSSSANSMEEDLELTTKVIMNHINSGDVDEGVVDDDE